MAGVNLETKHYGRSPQWRDGRFRNRLPRSDAPFMRMLREYFFGGSKHRKPAQPVLYETRVAADFAQPPVTGLRVTWLGHSSTIVELQSVRLLIDPVFGERASMFSFAGPRRFYPPPLPLHELPDIDAIIISHDHYDHLDKKVVHKLSRDVNRWITPLGVGNWLREWGVASDRITELDWWESTDVLGVTLTATPARHFSGRGLLGQDRTLWCGWTVKDELHNVYYSGDTAMQHEFVEIGERLGPFDLTMIEAGAYDAMWADVHLGPEQALRAHIDARGDAFLPLHWGLFDLALHSWTEPVERVLAAAQLERVRVIAPRPGAMFEPAHISNVERWWPEIPWRTASDAPVVSTGFEK